MTDQTISILRKLRMPFVGLLVLISLYLVIIVVSAARTSITSSTTSTTTSSMSDNPNVIAAGLNDISYRLGDDIDALNTTIGIMSSNIGTAATNTSNSIARGVETGASWTGRAVGTIVVGTARAVASVIVFAIRAPLTAIGYVADTSVVSSVIKPARTTSVPVINLDSPSLVAAHTATASPLSPQTVDASAMPKWPIHGAITTMFGVPHWPFQPTHTGIDISDGRRSGVTPINPYRPGRVIEVIHSFIGLGNHVVVDHGDGITSTYGHMALTSVQPGQIVDNTTVLGYEGSTGASTGTHLHLEIRINGRLVDPLSIIAGRP